MQGFVGPELYTELYIRRAALYAGLYRHCTIRRAVQALHYTQGCTGHELYAGLSRPNTECRAVQALHYRHGCIVPALYAGLYMHCTIRRAVKALHST